jgi:hypothetical protein
MTLILSGTDGLSDVDGSAATPAIRGTDANTGIFFPAADTIAFSEGGVESMRLDSSANLQFNSGYGSVATAYACRAWVNFNGTGTVAIRGSGNVTSITDNGTGNYTVNFTTAMPDRNYAVAQSAGRNDTGYAIAGSTTTPTTTAYVVTTYNGSFASSQDGSEIYVSIFR